MKFISLESLVKVFSFIKEIEGMRVIDSNIPSVEPKSQMASVPIVRNGADGIRFDFNPKRGFVIWFTNGYENPNDEVVVKIKDFISSL